MAVSELIVGTVCGGSDGTSGITGNPAAGRAFDLLVAEGAACIFEETGELIGCEHIMAARAITPELGAELESSVAKAARYYATLGYGSFAAGNAEGGLSTIEEKSMGAYAKSGASPISGLIKPGDVPPRGGLYLLDVVPDGEVRFGFPNINDNAEIAELIACGAHAVLFVTGRGSVVGSAISPVVKICANPETYRRMADDMDVDAGRILEGGATPRRGRHARSATSCSALGAGGTHQIRGARPPGIHPDLQELRADRTGLPAGNVTGEERGGVAVFLRALIAFPLLEPAVYARKRIVILDVAKRRSGIHRRAQRSTMDPDLRGFAACPG